MTMRPFTDNRGSLTPLVDAQIGRAFPVVHKVYQHLDAIEYVAQVYEAGRSRDIVIRTNHTKEWVEWQYKGEDTWTILFKFSDLLGADIADVVAVEQAIAAELEALRERILQMSDDALVARDQAQAAELGAIDAKNAAEAAQASALASAQNAVASAAASAQSAQGIDAVKAATEAIAATVETHRTAVALSAQEAADSAASANSAKDTAVSARDETEGLVSSAATASIEAKAAQQAAESSAQAAGQSEAVALGAANEAATSATAADVSAQTAAAHQVATEAAAAAGAQHLADVEAQVVSVEVLKQETVAAHQAGLAAKAGAEEAAVNAATFAENADVSAAESATSANQAEAWANAAELSAQSAAAHKAEAENQAVAAATSAQEATDKATAAEASALAAATSATTATEKLDEVSTLHDAAVTASTTATEAADTATTHLAQVTALHGATETFAQAAQASAEQADSAATAAGVSASDALQLRNETQGFRDAASTMVVDAAQVSADRATVQSLAQEVQLAADQVQSNALAAADSAGTAVASASAAADSATTAQTSANEILGQVSALTGRLDEADSIVTTVTALRDETLAYKLAAQDSTTNAQAVAADRAAVADMLVDVQANATAVSDAVGVTASAASAAQLAASSAENSSNAAAQQSAAAQAAQLAAESAAALATDANAGAMAALANHTAAADPHTQYLTKAESTDALASKVDKVVGKQLSTEDFTTSDRNKLNTIQEGAQVNPIPVINLASTDNTLPLAASQGKVLKGFIDQINQLLQSDDTTLDSLQEIVNFVKLNRADLNALGIDNIAGLRTALDGKQPVSSILTGTSASFTTALKTKLDAIAAQATKNETDAFLLDRANHTGTQPASSITGLTKASVGLSNADNTSDANKPISTATQTALNNKVDKVAGKQLSTEDYTAAEKSKLAGIAAGANAYTHPTNHPASVITQDANNRFVTDAEKAAWNAKQVALVSGTNIKTINGESLLGAGDIYVGLVEKFGTIGVAGKQGFGVGIYPTTLPAGFSNLPGTQDSASANYGNYQYSDESIMVFVPRFYYRIGHTSSPNYAIYGLNAIDIVGVDTFATEVEANAAGYAMHRAFIDGGQVKHGFFIDKYICSKSENGVSYGRSVRYGVPISLTTDTAYTRSAGMTGCTGIVADAVTLSRARGVGVFNCASIFMFDALAKLSLAHGQAATSATACAWFDPARTKNFPKGCNNSALSDVDDLGVTYQSAGDTGSAMKPKTGSANNLAKTAHNGQECGVVDINGCMHQPLLGLTQAGSSATANEQVSSGDAYTLKSSAKLADLTAGWNGATDAWGTGANLASKYDLHPGFLPWGTDTDWIQFGNGTAQVFSPALTGTDYLRSCTGVANLASYSAAGINAFGVDGCYRGTRGNLFPFASGAWGNGFRAGAFYRGWNSNRTYSVFFTGFRAGAYGL